MNAAVQIDTHSQSKKESTERTMTGMSFWHTFSIIRDLAYRLSFKPLFCNYCSVLLDAPKGMEESAPAIHYVGDGSQLAYLKTLCSEQPYIESLSTELSLLDVLRKRWQHSDRAITVYDFDFPLHFLLRLSGVAVPYWIKQKIELSDDWEAYLTRMRRKTRREAQRMIRKFNLQMQLVSGADYAEQFYDTLYAPYIRSRHGDSAVVIERAVALNKLRGSQIVQLLLADQVIGAAQIDTQGSTLSLGWTGLTDLSEKPELRGAADALDYFCMKHAFDTGCRTIDMGHSRAVLSDGILRYKKKWGAKVSAGVVPQGVMKFKFCDSSSAFIDFICENPLMSTFESELEAHVVIPAAKVSEQEIESYLLDQYVDGLAKIHVYCKAAQAEASVASVPCSVQFHPYENSRQLTSLLNQ